MDETTVADDTRDETAAVDEKAPDTSELLEDELLVEEISIDGMCGVY